MDGNNHAGGPIASIWSCIQDVGEISSTPTLCSLDGTTLDMIVGSTDGIYRINFPTITFDPGNKTRWPWTTFHYDAARTGCSTAQSTTMISSSIIGRVKNNGGTWLPGAAITVQWYDTSISDWVTDTPVNGRTGETRVNPISTVGDGTANNEINEGGFIINQLIPDRRYRLIVSKAGYITQTVNINSDQPIQEGRIIISDIVLLQ